MKLKIHQLDVLKDLSPEKLAAVMFEYSKEWHFISVIGKFSLLIFFMTTSYFSETYLSDLSWYYRGLILGISVYITLFFFNIIYVNLLAPRILRDLINHLDRK